MTRQQQWKCVLILFAAILCVSPAADAATIHVAAGGDLQKALNAAQPGDTILLEAGAEFLGNFVLPVKTGDGWITVRTTTPDGELPPEGVRIQPTHAPLLARVRSPNGMASLRTAAGTHHWILRYLEFPATKGGAGDIIQLGDGSTAQNTLARVPHHIVLDHVYVHGDPLVGQKRGIALNAAHVTIKDSFVSDIKAIGQDTQAICGWNGPGPYTIENNYLEAAGENVMFGGADPAIPGLVPDGITFRRNYVSRPMSWRDPLVATPQGLTASAESGGSLPPGLYGYRVVARRSLSNGVALSSPSAEAVLQTTADGAVGIRWQPVTGASEYRVYGRTPGGEDIFWTVKSTEFIDTGASGTSEAVPTSAGTRWTVKNLFELKNGRNVVVEDNIFENHWKQAQAGWAIVLTPRNSGSCSWCVVENVRFERNIVRNVAAGINLLGYDNSNPSRQTTNIVFRHNIFTGLTTALGGNGWFMQIGDAPRNVALEHNTIDGNGNTVLFAYGGSSTDPREIYGFRFVANAARHGTYGISAQSIAYGNASLEAYFPDRVFETNYLAGGSLSRLPGGTLVTNSFAEQFVDAAGGDYTVRDGSILYRAASDGTNIGADITALSQGLQGVKTGASEPVSGNAEVAPAAALSLSCTALSCNFADTSVAGSSPIASRSWTFGDGSAIANGPASGVHTFALAGTYTVGVTVSDANGLAAKASTTVTVRAPNAPPAAAFTWSCADLTCSFVDRSTDTDGTISTRNWAFGPGSSSAAAPSFKFPAAGTYDVKLTVSDDKGALGSVIQQVQATAKVHTSYSGTTKKWSSSTGKTQYWSATMTVAVHGVDERPIAGATVTANWSGAVTKTSSCVTGASGTCVLNSGTLSYLRSWVTLQVIGVGSAGSVYDAAANHDGTGTRKASFTLSRP